MKKFLILAVLLMATVAFGAEEKRDAGYLRQGAEDLAAGKYQKAANAFKQAVRLNPKSAEALQGLGMSYLKLGADDVVVNVDMLEQAASTFTRALAIATLCSCPPEISLGKRSSIPFRPTSSMILAVTVSPRNLSKSSLAKRHFCSAALMSLWFWFNWISKFCSASMRFANAD